MAVVQPAGAQSVSAVTSVFGRAGVVVATNGDYAGVVATHLTGATAATRYVGGTTSGAPVAGSFLLGDLVVAQNGHLFVCTVAGTPGTWVDAGSAGAVTSVFGRAGVVVATNGDYTAAQVGALASTATLDSIATANATAADVAMNSHKITGLANGSAASDAAAFGQLPAAIPSGAMFQYGAAAAPTGWLLCDGAAVSRTTFATLFGIIAVLYGAGDGSTTFNVPDMRGRVAAGYAASGGNTAVAMLGNSDGVAAANRRPQHRHSPHSHAYANNAAGQSGVNAAGVNNTGAVNTGTADGGSGTATDSLDAPAYLVVNYIIKT